MLGLESRLRVRVWHWGSLWSGSRGYGTKAPLVGVTGAGQLGLLASWGYWPAGATGATLGLRGLVLGLESRLRVRVGPMEW